MPNRAESAKLDWPRWQQALLIALLVLVIGTKMTMLVNSVALRAGLTGEFGYYGGALVLDPKAAPGFVKVAEVEPDGPLARAGVRKGDFVRTKPSYDRLRSKLVGEQFKFTLDQDGVKSIRQLTTEPVPDRGSAREYRTRTLLNIFAAIVALLISCLILWRGWGNKSAMLLGGALAAQGSTVLSVPPWASMQLLALPMWWLSVLGSALVFLLIPFAMRMFEESAGPLPRWHWHGVNAFIALAVFGYALFTWDMFALTNSLGWIGGANNVPLLVQIGYLASIAYLIAGWRKSAAASRNRFALIIFALTAYWLAALVAAWGIIQTGSYFARGGSGAPMYLYTLMVGLVAPSLLAYAMLRHKLFDLGFAVNRTLVYGTVSAVLLVGIGLTEYAVKSLLPKVWTQGSVFISAGLALGVFLIFHRIHHSVEHAIERLFFRKWQVNEAALKRFAAAAGHMEQPEALAGHFTTELARFTSGAAVALYARTADGQYASASGETVDADDLALAAMRAELGPMVPAEIGSPLDAALALPMMHQAALAGFILLGPKPTGEDYRPDEVEAMAWATQQVGLDLQAIRVRELELSNARLAAQNETLAGLVTAAALTPA